MDGLRTLLRPYNFPLFGLEHSRNSRSQTAALLESEPLTIDSTCGQPFAKSELSFHNWRTNPSARLAVLAPISLVVLATVGCGNKSLVPPPDASVVTQDLKAAGLPIRKVVVFNERTDPNQALGRPGQYVAKASWVDSRTNPPEAEPGVPASTDDGGSVETFLTEDDARRRVDRIEGVQQAVALAGTEYHYRVGRVVLRLSSKLTPADAEHYRSEFERILAEGP